MEMKSWESTLVSRATTLEKAISAMDKSALRIAIVVDEERRLQGTLTDGDVRRALLKHMPLDIQVADVMCSTPSTCQRGWSRERILATMEARQILHLPVVDADERVVGLETLHAQLEPHRVDNPVLLMAGGLGTRLQPLTRECPKPMLRLAGTPILELILKSFVEAGFHRFHISTHYLPQMIRDHFGDGGRWGVSIKYVHEETPLGTAGCIGLLPAEEVDHPVIVMNSDLVTTLDYKRLLDFHSTHGGAATVCVREYEHQVPYGVVNGDGQLIHSIDEKPIQKFFINAGVYVLSPALAQAIRPQTKIDMTTVLENAIRDGHEVAMFPVHEYWLDIGRMDDYKRAQVEIGGLLDAS